MSNLLLTGIGRLVTNDPARPGLLGEIGNGAVALVDGSVAWVGREAEVPARLAGLPQLDCGGRAALPGFVDPHTHLVFAGDRADEFGRRMRGESYEDILAAGGGIRSTVAATRAAPADALVAAASERLDRMLAHGTTTAEVKSGYGLDVETERRMLEVVARLDRLHSVDLVPTFLGAHVVPSEYAGEPEQYLRLIENEALAACAPLARFCDVFCDDGGFTVEEARRILSAGRAHGLEPRLHAEQLGPTGAARLAAELGAVSADHLDHIDAADAAALAAAGTVGVILPAVALSLQTAPPPGPLLWEAGVTVALATDCNPGTSYVESMQLVVALAVLDVGLLPEQAVWAATRGGALALQSPQLGWLGPGAAGDIVVLDAESVLHVPYRPGTNLAWKVVKSGAVVAG